MSLNLEVVFFSTYLRSRASKTQWKFGGAANDKSTCTTDK